MAIDGTDLRATRRELESALTDALARGDADPAALKLSARLGAVAAQIGNRHEARRHFRLVAAAGPAVLGATHPLVREADTFLGSVSPSGQPPRSPAIRPSGPGIERARPDELARTPMSRPTDDRRLGWRTRRQSLIWAVAASAAIAATAAAITTLWSRADGPATDSKPSAPVVTAPRHVTVAMATGVATVRWQDPTSGAVAFIVSGGVAGAKADIRQQVDAGQTSIVINGLNATRQYCFTVAAIYSADQIAVSDLVCTKH